MAKLGSVVLSSLNAVATVATDVGRVYTGAASPSATVGFDISGVYVGTILFEFTIDDANWFAVAAFPQFLSGLPGSAVLGTSGVGRFIVRASGYSQVRARMSAYTSGGATVATAITADQFDLAMLRELMIMNDLLVQGFNLPTDLDSEYRKDGSYGILP